MGVKLVSASAGSVELVAPVTASNYTATMPAGTGNVVVNGVNSAIVSGTAQASTSGTSIDFTSIPSWVKRVTVILSGVSTNGSSNLLIQIGDGSVNTTGYVSSYLFSLSTAVATNSSTSGFISPTNSSSDVRSGNFVLCLLGTNNWVMSGSCSTSTTSTGFTMGSKTLSGTLDRVRITTVNGTDTFDAGSINILYE